MTRGNRGALNMTLLAVSCGLLMVMPLVTTLDDFLTTWALRFGADNPLQALVPGEARMVVEGGGCNRILTIPVAWGVSLFRGARSPGCGPRHMSRLGVLVTRRFVEHVHRSDRVDALVDTCIVN